MNKRKFSVDATAEIMKDPSGKNHNHFKAVISLSFFPTPKNKDTIEIETVIFSFKLEPHNNESRNSAKNFFRAISSIRKE